MRSALALRGLSSCKGSYARPPRNVCTPVIKMMMTLTIVYWFQFLQCSVLGKAVPLQACAFTYSSRRLDLLEFLDILHKKVANLSALCTEHPLLIFGTGYVDPRVSRPEVLSHWKSQITPSGIKPATFRHCLPHNALYRVASNTEEEWYEYVYYACNSHFLTYKKTRHS